MKQTLLIIALFATSLFANATVRTVNNNNPSPGQYSTIGAAITAAASGDTLLVAASPYSYNTIVINKPLTLIGSGHNPATSNPQRTFCDYIQFASNSSGSSVIGFDCQQIYTQASNISNIKIIRNKVTYLIYDAGYGGQNNWLFESNVFTASYGASYACIDFGNQSNIHDFVIRNNIFYGTGVGRIGYYYNNAYNIYIQHNIFMGNNPAFKYDMDATYYVNDNIFYGASPRTTSGYRAGTPIYSNNISYNCYNSDNSFPNGTNTVNTDPQFIGSFTLPVSAYATTHNFNLQSGSVGKNAASDGTDIGVYGGTAIYNQNGIPAVPYIKSLTINGSNTVPANGTLNITVKSKIGQ